MSNIMSVRARRAASQAGPAIVQAQGFKFTARPTEWWTRNYGNDPAPGHGFFVPEAHAEVNFVGHKTVPRLFKPGISGWASPSNPGHPFSASMGEFTQLRTPHMRPRTLPRNSPRAVGTGASLRPASSSRISPVRVPRAAFAR